MAEGRAFVSRDIADGLVELSIYVRDDRDGATINEATLDTILGNTAQVAVEKAVTVPAESGTPAVEAVPEAPAVEAPRSAPPIAPEPVKS